MPMLPLSALELLTTTRAVRKRLDFTRPVELALITRCVEIALQGPSGSNMQGWSFVVVTDAAKREALAELYRRAFDAYRHQDGQAAGSLFQDDPARAGQQRRVMDSADYLARHMHEVPVLVVPCLEGRVDARRGDASRSDGEASRGSELLSAAMPSAAMSSAAMSSAASPSAAMWGSLLPAAWNFMLAARLHGLGTAWTTLHLRYEREAAEVLGIPYERVSQGLMTPLAYTKGTRFREAQRKPLAEVLRINSW